MTKKAVWISYDFGLKGDYTGLFTWLDNMKAVECGNGLAHIKLDLELVGLNLFDSNEIPEYIKQSLAESVKLSKTDRIYIIWRDNSTSNMKGRFINGNRKQPPWEGYGKLRESETTDDGE